MAQVFGHHFARACAKVGAREKGAHEIKQVVKLYLTVVVKDLKLHENLEQVTMRGGQVGARFWGTLPGVPPFELTGHPSGG